MTLEKLPSADRAFLTKLAKDILLNLVFTDRHVQDKSLLPNVFMIISLGGLQGTDLDDIGMVYEYLDKAGPLMINGYPIFLSMRILNKADANFVCDEFLRLDDALNSPSPLPQKEEPNDH